MGGLINTIGTGYLSWFYLMSLKRTMLSIKQMQRRMLAMTSGA